MTWKEKSKRREKRRRKKKKKKKEGISVCDILYLLHPYTEPVCVQSRMQLRVLVFWKNIIHVHVATNISIIIIGQCISGMDR